MSQNNQMIGFINKREKLQDKRGISLTTPLSAAYYQTSRNYPMKAEWTSVLGSRAFLDVLAGNWWNFFPLRPVRDFGLYDGPWAPRPHRHLATSQIFDGGANNGYQDQKRCKPQVYISLSYFKDGWAGSHDFKVGYDWKRDRRSLFRDQPFDIFYRDNGAGTCRPLAGRHLQLVASPASTTSSTPSGWINDTWKLTNRLTVNLGVRYRALPRPAGRSRSSRRTAFRRWPAGPTRAIRTFIAPRTVEAAHRGQHQATSRRRVGFAYDLTGDNRTVLKAYYGQSRWNSADTLADKENPVGLAQLRYAFVAVRRRPDHRLRPERRPSGRAARRTRRLQLHRRAAPASSRSIATSTARSATRCRPNVERELVTGLSARVSYVYKNMRNVWGEDDPIRNGAYTVPFTITDPGAGQRARHRRRPDVPDLRSAGGHRHRTRLHQPRRLRRRLPHRRVRAQPPHDRASGCC